MLDPDIVLSQLSDLSPVEPSSPDKDWLGGFYDGYYRCRADAILLIESLLKSQSPDDRR